MKQEKATIREVFNSIQGEGVYLGVRQVFVRFQGCPLRCNYCDSSETWNYELENCRVEKTPGGRDFYTVRNPLDVNALLRIIRKLWLSSTKHLSLTGGEPLLFASFIAELSSKIDKKLYLETNSALPAQAEQLKHCIDIASCDIKLLEHGKFDDYDQLLKDELETIKIFHRAKVDVFTKIVVLEETTSASISPAVEGLARISKKIPLILQPVTPVGKIKDKPSPKKLLELMEFAGRKLLDVRVIPQAHKIAGFL
jgi:organic radical activating enzyme